MANTLHHNVMCRLLGTRGFIAYKANFTLQNAISTDDSSHKIFDWQGLSNYKSLLFPGLVLNCTGRTLPLQQSFVDSCPSCAPIPPVPLPRSPNLFLCFLGNKGRKGEIAQFYLPAWYKNRLGSIPFVYKFGTDVTFHISMEMCPLSHTCMLLTNNLYPNLPLLS